MTRTVVLAIGAVLVATGATSMGTASSLQTSPVRVIDRTLRCTIFVHAGIRQIEFEGQPGIRDAGDPSKWSTSPSAEAESYGLPNTPYGGLVALSAGRLQHNRTRCVSVRTSVALTPRGLTGGQASTFGDAFDCNSQRRVLVRVRAAFQEPVRLRLDWTDSTKRHKEMIAEGPLQTGAFVIRTERGRPIAYADVVASGRVRLFTAASCFPD